MIYNNRLLLSYLDVYGRKDKHYFVNLYHMNGRNERFERQIYHFAKLAKQITPDLSMIFD